MSNKTSKVKKCNPTSDWKSPAGTTIYYHEVEFENGDKGSCGRNKNNPDDMAIGCEIEYTITDNKIKFIKSLGGRYMEQKQNNTATAKTYTNNKKNPQEFLGYAYAYAKDMVIAGKTSEKDVADLKFIAETIYGHIKDMLEGKQPIANEEPPF